MTVKLAVSGCRGRMGGRIVSLAAADDRFEVVAGLEHSGHADLGKSLGELAGLALPDVRVTDRVQECLKEADCLIEFTTPEATLDHLETVVESGKRIVIGTTGLSPEGVTKIREASEKIPVVFSPNMSVGVNVLFSLTGRASGVLTRDYAVKILEAHHRHKKDALSGTAKRLGEIIRSGGARPDIQSVREGEIVGEHTVFFNNEFEEIQLVHKARSRDAFVLGALEAAWFLNRKGKGLYDMQQVLGLAS